MPGMSSARPSETLPHFGASIKFPVADGPEQYVKQEVSEIGEHGRVVKATRLITERTSTRIGKMACEIALQRPRKVRSLVQCSSIRYPSRPLR